MLQLDQNDECSGEEENSFFFEGDQNPKVTIAVNVVEGPDEQIRGLKSTSQQKSSVNSQNLPSKFVKTLTFMMSEDIGKSLAKLEDGELEVLEVDDDEIDRVDRGGPTVQVDDVESQNADSIMASAPWQKNGPKTTKNSRESNY